MMDSAYIERAFKSKLNSMLIALQNIVEIQLPECQNICRTISTSTCQVTWTKNSKVFFGHVNRGSICQAHENNSPCSTLVSLMLSTVSSCGIHKTTFILRNEGRATKSTIMITGDDLIIYFLLCILRINTEEKQLPCSK